MTQQELDKQARLMLTSMGYAEASQTVENFIPPPGITRFHQVLKEAIEGVFKAVFDGERSLQIIMNNPDHTEAAKLRRMEEPVKQMLAGVTEYQSAVVESVAAINSELARKARPRPPSDDPATLEFMLSNARSDARMALSKTRGSVSVPQQIAELAEQAVNNGETALAYLLICTPWSERFLQSKGIGLEVWSEAFLPKLLPMLVSDKQQVYLEAQAKAKPLVTVPVMTNHAWHHYQAHYMSTAAREILNRYKSQTVQGA